MASRGCFPVARDTVIYEFSGDVLLYVVISPPQESALGLFVCKVHVPISVGRVLRVGMEIGGSFTPDSARRTL